MKQHTNETTRDMVAYFRWMQELSDEGERRGYDAFPLDDDLLSKHVCCWVEDFDKGVSPLAALDQSGFKATT